jgi:hypothetical protein
LWIALLGLRGRFEKGPERIAVAHGIDNPKGVQQVGAHGIGNLAELNIRDARIDLLFDPIGFPKPIDGFAENVRLRNLREILEHDECERENYLKPILPVKPLDHGRIIRTTILRD